MSLKVKIRNSITFRITGWLFLVMTVLMILTFAVFRLVSGSILQKTIRGYLLSSVNENTNKIAFYQDREQADDNDLNDVYIRYKDGWLEIDDDFLDEINDVQSALYTSDGTMLYGKNPIARLMEKEAFTTSRVYRYMAGGGDRYFVYDRKLNGTAMEDLWIRGVVPLWSEERQIEDIFRTSIFFVPVLLLAATGTASNNTAHMKHRIRQIKPVFFIIFPRYLIVGLVRPLNLVYNITETLYQFFFFESMRGGIMQ